MKDTHTHTKHTRMRYTRRPSATNSGSKVWGLKCFISLKTWLHGSKHLVILIHSFLDDFWCDRHFVPMDRDKWLAKNTQKNVSLCSGVDIYHLWWYIDIYFILWIYILYNVWETGLNCWRLFPSKWNVIDTIPIAGQSNVEACHIRPRIDVWNLLDIILSQKLLVEGTIVPRESVVYYIHANRCKCDKVCT